MIQLDVMFDIRYPIIISAAQVFKWMPPVYVVTVLQSYKLKQIKLSFSRTNLV